MNSNKTIGEFTHDVIRARAEAFRQNIKANAVLINKNLVKIPELYHIPLLGAGVVPPMICGLGVYDAGELLPEDYAFAVTRIETSEEESQRKATLHEAYSECYEWLKENMDWDEECVAKRFYEHFLEENTDD